MVDAADHRLAFRRKPGQDQRHRRPKVRRHHRRAAEVEPDRDLAAIRVPEQTIEGGVVRLDILAARLARVQVRGDAGANEGLLARYLAKLEQQPVFNLIEAERALLLAREIPGLDARLTLRPSANAGEVVGEVIIRRTPVMIDFNAQNFGTNDVGALGLVARARFNGITGLGDQTSFSLYGSGDLREQRIVQVGHEMRLGGDGLRLGVNYTHAWTRPDLATLDFRSKTQIASLFASYPIRLTQAERWTVTGGIDVIDQNIGLGTTPLNRDRLRVLTLQSEHIRIDPASVAGRNGYNSAEPRWLVAGTTEWRKGLAGLGASKPCGPLSAACLAPGAVPLSRIEGKPDAFLVRWNGQMEWRPVRNFTLALLPRGQWTDDPLLAYEEFSAGNFTVGRGYDPGSLIGDRGLGVSAEARLRSLIPENRTAIAAQPFIFFDAAWVWNRDSAFAGIGAQSIYSAGGGVRVAYGDMVRFDVALAAPLKRAPFATSKGDARVLISLTTAFGLGGR
ncbi:MAG: ShlB/FhaC/HecB family hemolysin secretion/activation protein [Sphingopyxis sp.]|nr:ShlB/FhaC/HecB family hemolysin secretion/activation protein [Sphingopyxis sp.]